MTRAYLCLIMLFINPGVHAQDPADYGFEKVGNIPSNTVYDILIDKKGYVWISHELGVSRYNGLSFSTFHHPRQSSLGSDNLIEDSMGRIWYRNFNGQIFYIDQEKVNMLNSVLPNAYFQSFVISGDELLVRSGESLIIHNIRTHQSRAINTTPDNMPLNKMSPMYSNGDKVYIHIYNEQNRILVYEKGSFTNIRYTLPAGEHPIRIITANDTNLVLLAQNKNQASTLFFYRPKEQPMPVRSHAETILKASYIWSTYDHGRIWVHSPQRSYSFTGTDTIRNLSLTDLVTDREGNTWATSMRYGLLLKKKQSSWHLLKEYAGKNCFTKINTLQDRVVAASYNGDVIISDTADFPAVSNRKQKQLNNDHIGWHLTENNLYLFPLNKTSGKKRQSISSSYSVKDACHIDSNTIVFGTHTGLIAITEAPGKPQHGIISTHFIYNAQGMLSYNISRRVRSVDYDPATRSLYAGFSHGLYIYTDTSASEIQFNHLPIHAYRIKSYKEKIYVATQSNGILVIKNRQIIRNITVKDGLLSTTVLGLKIYNNHLWISGMEDVQLYDMEQEAFVHSVSLPPVKAPEVYDIAEVNGRAYFSAIEGLYVIPLNNIRDKEILPLNYLTNVIVNATDTVYAGSSLPWQKNNLQFSLDGLYYFDTKRIYFTYRLIGSGNDTNWKASPPGQNKIQLSYLPPGKYNFEARAHTANGLSAAEPIAFSFTIDKPWWQLTWVILSTILLVTGTTVIYTRNRVNTRKKDNQVIIEKLQYENELNESELKALKSQMNPHFIFNSLNTIQEMFMWGDKNAANEQMANFATLTRLVLTVSEKRSILLSTEIDILKKYLELEKMRFLESFSYEIIIDEEIDEGYLQIPPMIIQPFLENSIKHGLLHKEGEKKISIIFQLIPEKDYIICMIRDNGIGRAKAAEIRSSANYSYNSFSTDATKKRLHLIYKDMNNQLLISYTDLKDTNGDPTGTSVRIMVPTFR